MKFIGTAAFVLTMGCAMANKLGASPAMDGAKSQCGSGSISCCDSTENISADGILGNLLAGGLLNGLLGNSNSACASTSLIDELNLLAQVKNTKTGPVCKNIIACCPEGTKECIAVDNSGN
ncbi:uncharacterized protein N7515_004167 [Penicillium bovifimosum]|uniref:Hydrophobin n=1 Tax=Penicillium bovifimosum TaxID=126998 RepID=A0A9W9L6G6_9EURO|nr:uncharacterized protein N7515_004167 [Penicillium bovifimosum]KAJ5139319.1 hypothetical protein N7515_004167 [Penicillium bovifimosum]